MRKCLRYDHKITDIYFFGSVVSIEMLACRLGNVFNFFKCNSWSLMPPGVKRDKTQLGNKILNFKNQIFHEVGND
jgi:hypothetical protein